MTILKRSQYSKPLLLIICLASFLQAQQSVTVTAYEGADHTFHGLGAGSCNWSEYYNDLPQATRTELAELVWGPEGADFRVCRLWAKSDGSSTPESMWKRYSQYRADVHAANDKVVFLLAPWGRPNNSSEATQRPYAAQFAAIAKHFSDKGAPFDVTGICNEPQVSMLIPPERFPSMVKLFRQEFDKVGLKDIAIIGPEFSNVDAMGFRYMNNLIADSDALKALDGFALHSYNMSMTKKMRDLLKPHGKELWQTEASDNGPEADIETMLTRASMGTGRVLSDVNLGVTHWMWFVAYDDRRHRGASDIATHVLTYDAGPSCPDDQRIGILLKYYYLKQVSHTFRPGAKVRFCSSDLGGGSRYEFMENTFGARPPINALVALNTDGSWALGLQNMTGNRNAYFGGTPITEYPSAQTYTVAFHVEELGSKGDTEFRVWRSNASKHFEEEDPVTMKGGNVSVTAQAMELVTLRSAPTIGVAKPNDGAGPGWSSLDVRMRGNTANGNATFIVSYTIPRDLEWRDKPVAIRVRDARGRLVKRLPDTPALAGTHTVRWDSGAGETKVSAGVYVLELTLGSSGCAHRFFCR